MDTGMGMGMGMGTMVTIAPAILLPRLIQQMGPQRLLRQSPW